MLQVSNKKFKKKGPEFYTQGQSNYSCMTQCLHASSEAYTDLTLSTLTSTSPTRDSDSHLHIDAVDCVHLAELVKQVTGWDWKCQQGPHVHINSILTSNFILKAMGNHRNILSRKLQGSNLHFKKIILTATWKTD